MEVLPKLSAENQEVLEKLARMVNFTKEQLTGKPVHKDELNLKQLVLTSMFAAVNAYTEAIFELCKQSRPDAAIVILRSIVEAWINTMFVLGHPNNRHLYLFAIEDSYYRKSLIKQMQDYYIKYPNQRSSILTKKELENIAKVPEQELGDYKSKTGISFKTKDEFNKEWKGLLQRAVSVDARLKKRQKEKAGGFEHSYLMVYKHLSEYTHLSLRGLQHFWGKDSRGDTLVIDKNPDKIDLVLHSTYTFYLFFAQKLKQYKIIEGTFAEYQNFFENKIAKNSNKARSG